MPEQARRALIDLIRSAKPGDLADFPLERYANEAVAQGGDTAFWGPFCLHFERRDYTYCVAFGQPQRVCRWHFRGRFVLQKGRWRALAPEVECRTLEPE
jgi:hypothetical protein